MTEQESQSRERFEKWWENRPELTSARNPYKERAFQVWQAAVREERQRCAQERDVLKRLVDKLKIILPKVDSIIALQVARAGTQIYDGPNIEQEMKEAEELLSRG